VANDPSAQQVTPIRHDAQQSRFFVPLVDGDAELIYAPFNEDVLDLQHTEVPPSGQGRGIGDALVMATCPYVQAWLRKHPEERPS
jgi:predicted GNAT family acetyltransferase